MRLVRIGIAGLSPTVGAIRSNGDAVVAAARAMAAEGVGLACFGEQVLGGYPPEDLVQWRAFLTAQRRELERVADATADLPPALIVGLAVEADGLPYNVAAVLHRGRILGFVPKEKLPTYEVFYEARTLARGAPGLLLDSGGIPLGDQVFELDFGVVAPEVCEDGWTPDGPMRRRCFSGAEVVVNLSASPYRVGFAGTRREMLATRSADNQATLVWVNLVGGQDGLVFDGGGCVFQNGRLALEAPRFQEGWWSCVVDLDRTRARRGQNSTWRSDREAFLRSAAPVRRVPSGGPTADRSRLPYPAPPPGALFLPPADAPVVPPRAAVLDDLFEAVALGVADYYRKTGAFAGIGVAVSGGRDSLLTLLVAWRAAQRLRERAADAATDVTSAAEAASPRLAAFYMPSRYSKDATAEAARTICRELDVPLLEVPIEGAIDRELDAVRDMLGGGRPTELTEQNVQARLRGARMWSWANSARALFLQPGDMSEKAVGYTTLGGDLEGGLSPIANIPKTVVIALLERLHERFGFEGIRRTLGTEPGPELAADQAAEAELMPFEVLDACLWLFAGERMSGEEAAAALPRLFPEVDPAVLERHARRFAELFTRSIFKWVQSPLSLHVGTLDLERERALQLPVVQRTEW